MAVHTHLWKYSVEVDATTAWILPNAETNSFFTVEVQAISNSVKKCFATSTSASFGHGWNQSMVHPEMRAGNLIARLRNFSPTWKKKSLSYLLSAVKQDIRQLKYYSKLTWWLMSVSKQPVCGFDCWSFSNETNQVHTTSYYIYLNFSTCFGQRCVHHQENLLYLCDTGIFHSVWVAVWSAGCWCFTCFICKVFNKNILHCNQG